MLGDLAQRDRASTWNIIGPFLHSPNSHNHVYLCGAISSWMWTQFAGLNPTSPAFSTISISPRIHPTLGPSSLHVTYSSPRGNVTVTWNRTANSHKLPLAILVPVGVERALVSVPLPYAAQSYITESGTAVWVAHRAPGQQSTGDVEWLESRVKLDGTRVVDFRVDSGHYRFQAF